MMDAARLQWAIEKAGNFSSYITDGRGFEFPGFSQVPLRCLVNILCREYAPVTYLEVGLFCGATFAAAMCENEGRFIGIDDFRQRFGHGHELTPLNNGGLQSSVQKAMDLLGNGQATLMVQDYKTVDVTTLPLLDVLFYDAEHSAEGTALGLNMFGPRVRSGGVILVDDWGWKTVREGLQLWKAARPEGMIGYSCVMLGPSWGDGVFIGLVK